MRLATLKKDFYFRRGGPRISGGVLPKGTVVQVGKEVRLWKHRLLAPGGLVSFVEKDELNNVVEFLDNDDETGHT